MIALAIIVFILVLAALLRIGIIAEFGEDGALVYARIGPFKRKLFPQKEKTGKRAERKAAKAALKKAERKKKKELAKAAAADEKKPGLLKDLKEMLPAVKQTLSRLRRRLLVKKLTVWYLAAGEDAAKTAMTYGNISVAFGAFTPLLENSFKIKRRDFRTAVDFIGTQPKIYVSVHISLAVWECVYIALGMVSVLLKKLPAKSTKRKEAKQNG